MAFLTPFKSLGTFPGPPFPPQILGRFNIIKPLKVVSVERMAVPLYQYIIISIICLDSSLLMILFDKSGSSNQETNIENGSIELRGSNCRSCSYFI